MKNTLVSLLLAVAAASCSAAETVASGQLSEAALQPFWQSDTMVDESVLFVRQPGAETAEAALLFEPTRILSVRTSAQDVNYIEDRDYIWTPGTKQIRLGKHSGIVWKNPQDLRRPANSQRYALTHRDGNGEILFGGGHEYHDMQTLVTYTHKPGAWAGPIPAFAADQLPRTTDKLLKKMPVTIAMLGDSISTGCNASGWAKTPPFQPPYQDLFARNLELTYGAKVTLKNFAVGGTDTAWGVANVGKLIEAQPDLVILAFGMNDASGRPADEYQSNVRAMLEAISAVRPEVEFILVATMLGNRDWVTLRPELFPQYRDALAQLCRPGVVLADLTAIWAELLEHKRDWDLTGNGVNHPNDFGHRIYAQTLSALMIAAPHGTKQAAGTVP